MITWNELRIYLNQLDWDADPRLRDNITIMRQDGEFMAVDDILEMVETDILDDGSLVLKEL